MSGVAVHDLPLEYLSQLKENLDNDVNQAGKQLQQLHMLMSRFSSSEATLEALGPHVAGAPVLVPLTSSLYVPGTLADADNVIVNLGTGYYIKQPVADAVAYVKRRYEFLRLKSKEIEQMVAEKQRNSEICVQVMRQKIAASEKEAGKA
jgi:prefoldin alpha subunit